MENKEFSKEFEVRTRQFAIHIIKLSAALPIHQEAKIIKNQITKSGTSIGANYREANRSKSRADFINKIRICEAEASETVYWMEIISELKWISPEKTKPLLHEAEELLALFTAIGKKLRK